MEFVAASGHHSEGVCGYYYMVTVIVVIYWFLVTSGPPLAVCETCNVHLGCDINSEQFGQVMSPAL